MKYTIPSYDQNLSYPYDLTHECGLALVRLLKPLDYYKHTYQSHAWGTYKMLELIGKQRNRGQDSVGLSVLQFDKEPGRAFMKRSRSCEKNALEAILEKVTTSITAAEKLATHNHAYGAIKNYSPFIGELYLGHLRYATHGGNDIEYAQPRHHRHSIPAKNVMLAGNFNMTNSAEIMTHIVSHGLSPSDATDTLLVMNHIGYCIDRAYEQTFNSLVKQGHSVTAAAKHASDHLDITAALREAALHWDGGYVFAGMVGNGDAFICRDPAGIRPGFYYLDDEVFAAASERSALMNAFNLQPEKIKEIPPAQVIVIKKNNSIFHDQFTPLLPPRKCTFERIYFSRPSDPDIYRERKALGTQLAQRVFDALNHSLENCIFSYIPNSSEIPFNGLIEQINELLFNQGYNQLLNGEHATLSLKDIIALTHTKARIEKLIYKDQVIRTFIANDSIRNELVSKVYDVTAGVVTSNDTLITIDDSIVRGTTLRQSIIKQLVMLNPKRIIVISAAPIILYPDCYGIDMSQIGNLIAFQAAIALTQEQGNQSIIDDLYQECVALYQDKKVITYNPIQKLYKQFTQDVLEQKITELIYPRDTTWSGEIKVMYQTIQGLHNAIPNFTGDWYFTGNYPTPGGYRIVTYSFMQWYTGQSGRAYETGEAEWRHIQPMQQQKQI